MTKSTLRGQNTGPECDYCGLRMHRNTVTAEGKTSMHMECRRKRLAENEDSCIICTEPIKRSYTAAPRGNRAHRKCWVEVGVKRFCALPDCSQEFTAHSSTQTYCERYHAMIAHAYKNGPACSVCGEQMQYSRHHGPTPTHQKCTNPDLVRKRNEPGKSWSVIRRAILERDAGTCQICFVAVPGWAEFPSPLSAAVDHIIPVAQTGTPNNELDNLRLTHAWCNSTRKHTGVDEEVAKRARAKWAAELQII